MGAKAWFITGASRGFGRVWAEAALKRGDWVATAARNLSSLDDLVQEYGENILPVELDVTDRQRVFDSVAAAHKVFGRLDVVINNAGYGLFGTIEEITEEAARKQMEVNLFGALWVTQAALPIMRAQGSGHILATSSVGGVVTFPTLGLYHASKWALEAFNDALAQEVAPFGINVTLIEPGGYATDWGGSSADHVEQIEAYAGLRAALARHAAGVTQGDPTATTEAILKVVDADEPPLRLVLGDHALPFIRMAYESRLKTWADWESVSNAAQGNV